jgi:hypothetical protein
VSVPCEVAYTVVVDLLVEVALLDAVLCEVLYTVVVALLVEVALLDAVL